MEFIELKGYKKGVSSAYEDGSKVTDINPHAILGITKRETKYDEDTGQPKKSCTIHMAGCDFYVIDKTAEELKEEIKGY